MFNDRLSTEAAKERITQRMLEVEGYASQKRLGYSETGTSRWIFALMLLLILISLSLLV
jgi:hypothetical protein